MAQERVLAEWTDGRLVVQTVQVLCNGEPEREPRRRLFQYGRQPPSSYKRMRQVTGWDQGPVREARHWSPEQLDELMQQWLASIPPSEPEDRQIVESVQLVLRGALRDGMNTDSNHTMAMRYWILSNLGTFLDFYMRQNAPLGRQCEALCNDMSALSC
jgi:hypothetical protein